MEPLSPKTDWVGGYTGFEIQIEDVRAGQPTPGLPNSRCRFKSTAM
jgi:hypothetical protein